MTDNKEKGGYKTGGKDKFVLKGGNEAEGPCTTVAVMGWLRMSLYSNVAVYSGCTDINFWCKVKVSRLNRMLAYPASGQNTAVVKIPSNQALVGWGQWTLL